MIGVTLELDRLLDVVVGIAGEVKKDADARLKVETLVIVAMSLGLALLALILPTGKNTSKQTRASTPVSP